MTKNNVTLPPAIDTLPMADGSLITATLPGAIAGLAYMATAREKAKVSCLAFADAVKVTHGTLDVLTANGRSKASDNLKAIHTALKEAFLSVLWGEAFAAWVNGVGADCEKSPKRGQKGQPRKYWQQQKGNLWNKAGSGFVSKVLAFVAENATEATDTKDANRKAKSIDDACRDNVNASIKRIETAVRDAKDIPPHVDIAAFLILAKLACDALEKGKAHKAKAHAALNAIRAAKIVM
jgi:hypothetical protein